jgi:hypothetical protein
MSMTAQNLKLDYFRVYDAEIEAAADEAQGSTSAVPLSARVADGGTFVSTGAGKSFEPTGLHGVSVGGLAINGAGTRLFAASWLWHL